MDGDDGRRTELDGGSWLQLAPSVELVGEYESHAYEDPPRLARLGDGRVVRLTPILWAIASAVDGRRDAADIADLVEGGIGADDVQELVDNELRPAGVVAGPGGEVAHPERLDPLTALTTRGDLVPAHWTRRLARPLAPLLRWPLMGAVLVAFLLVQAWAIGEVGLATAADSAIRSPAAFLVVLALTIGSASFHELGHAAALSRAGREPGAMGAGFLLVFPALYTDVTEAYLLPRSDRLKVDLAGIYFNMLFALGIAAVAAASGELWLTAAVVLQLVLVVQQLLPFVRFDGYYIVSDLIGVPDLYLRLPDLLRRLLPGREPSFESTALRPWARRTATAWALATVLLGVAVLGFIVISLRSVVAGAAGRSVSRFSRALDALGELDLATAGGALLQGLVELLLPAGFAVLALRLGRRAGSPAIEWLRDRLRHLRRRRRVAQLEPDERDVLRTAATDEHGSLRRQRARMVLAGVAGTDAEKIAAYVDESPEDVRRLERRFRARGVDVLDDPAPVRANGTDRAGEVDEADLAGARSHYRELLHARTAQVRASASALGVEGRSSMTKAELAGRIVERRTTVPVDEAYQDLWAQTRDELYECARARKIGGRASMTKAELIDELAPDPEAQLGAS